MARYASSIEINKLTLFEMKDAPRNASNVVLGEPKIYAYLNLFKTHKNKFGFLRKHFGVSSITSLSELFRFPQSFIPIYMEDFPCNCLHPAGFFEAFKCLKNCCKSDEEAKEFELSFKQSKIRAQKLLNKSGLKTNKSKVNRDFHVSKSNVDDVQPTEWHMIYTSIMFHKFFDSLLRACKESKHKDINFPFYSEVCCTFSDSNETNKLHKALLASSLLAEGHNRSLCSDSERTRSGLKFNPRQDLATQADATDHTSHIHVTPNDTLDNDSSKGSCSPLPLHLDKDCEEVNYYMMSTEEIDSNVMTQEEIDNALTENGAEEESPFDFKDKDDIPIISKLPEKRKKCMHTSLYPSETPKTPRHSSLNSPREPSTIHGDPTQLAGPPIPFLDSPSTRTSSPLLDSPSTRTSSPLLDSPRTRTSSPFLLSPRRTRTSSSHHRFVCRFDYTLIHSCQDEKKN